MESYNKYDEEFDSSSSSSSSSEDERAPPPPKPTKIVGKEEYEDELEVITPVKKPKTGMDRSRKIQSFSSDDEAPKKYKSPYQKAQETDNRKYEAYVITTITANKPSAGTDAKVFIILNGTKNDSSGKVWLHGKFKRGGTDVFRENVADIESPIKDIEIGHDCSGGRKQTWNLQEVRVYSPKTGIQQIFPVYKLLSTDAPSAVVNEQRSLQKIIKEEDYPTQRQSRKDSSSSRSSSSSSSSRSSSSDSRRKRKNDKVAPSVSVDTRTEVTESTERPPSSASSHSVNVESPRVHPGVTPTVEETQTATSDQANDANRERPVTPSGGRRSVSPLERSPSPPSPRRRSPSPPSSRSLSPVQKLPSPPVSPPRSRSPTPPPRREESPSPAPGPHLLVVKKSGSSSSSSDSESETETAIPEDRRYISKEKTLEEVPLTFSYERPFPRDQQKQEVQAVFDYQRPFTQEQREALRQEERPRMATSGSSVDSSSDSSDSESEMETTRPPVAVVADVRTEEAPVTQKASTEIHGAAKVEKPSESETETETETQTETETETDTSKVIPARPPSPKKTRERSSESSSESETETETDTKSNVPPPPKPPSPVALPTVKDDKRRSSDSSSSSSSSESETETETDAEKQKKKDAETVPPPPPVTIPKTEKVTSSSSSSSGSETETQTETDTEKIKKPPSPPPAPKPVPAPEVKKEEPQKKSSEELFSITTITSDKPGAETDANVYIILNGTNSKSSEKIWLKSGKFRRGSKDKFSQKLRDIESPIKDIVIGHDCSGSQPTWNVQEVRVYCPRTEIRQTFPVYRLLSTDNPSLVVIEQRSVQKIIKSENESSDSDSGSDSSSDSSSGSESELTEDDKKKMKRETAKEVVPPKAVFDMSDSDAPHIASASDGTKFNVFGSETETDDMHGGNDPDSVTAGPLKSAYLSKIGVKPGQPLEGSILPIVDGQTDIDLSAVTLTTAQVKELGTYIEKATNIKTVCLRNCGIDDDKFDKMVDSLEDTESDIKMLNLNLNKLDESAAADLADMMGEKPSVDILLLHGNPLGDKGVRNLLQGILDVSEPVLLRELDLGDTGMGDAGMAKVATFLQKNQTLKTLNLNSNKSVTLTGWQALGKALNQNRSLQTLSLDFNNIGDEGIGAIVEGLRTNQTLQTLELEDAGISKKGGKILRDLVKDNPSILEVTIFPGNGIPDDIRDDIKKFLGLSNEAYKKTQQMAL